jgi:hypothetical protein
MVIEFSGEVIEWRGPAPFFFVPVPQDLSDEIKSVSRIVTYGWGCIPVSLQVGETRATTALIPRKGIYMVPIKVAVQRAEGVGLGDLIGLRVELGTEIR